MQAKGSPLSPVIGKCIHRIDLGKGYSNIITKGNHDA